MMKKERTSSPTLIVKIEIAPYSGVRPSYGEYRPGYHRYRPIHEGASVVKMLRGSKFPRIAYRYLICSDQKFLNKVTTAHANNFTHYFERIH